MIAIPMDCDADIHTKTIFRHVRHTFYSPIYLKMLFWHFSESKFISEDTKITVTKTGKITLQIRMAMLLAFYKGIVIISNERGIYF